MTIFSNTENYQINERYQIFSNYHQFQKYSKIEQEMLHNHFYHIVRIKYFMGEPIIGKFTGIYCKSIIDIIKGK